MYELIALLRVIAVDVALSLDNAVLISAVAQDVPEAERQKVKLMGIGGAVLARVVLALFTSFFLKYTAFTFLGGAYLVWVAWSMWRHKEREGNAGSKSLFGPVLRIVIADVVMSMDNILAVAHSARGHNTIMVFGIALSIVLMFAATGLISAGLKRWPWTFQLAVMVVAITGAHMLWSGAFTRV